MINEDDIGLKIGFVQDVLKGGSGFLQDSIEIPPGLAQIGGEGSVIDH